MSTTMDVLINCVAAIGGCYVLGYIMILIVIQILRRFARLDVQIGSVGLLAFTNIKITAQRSATIVIEVEKIWISSSFFNENTKSIVGLCICGLRLQVDLPSHKERKFHKKNEANSFKYLGWIYSSFTKWLHVHFDSICITVKGGRLGDCIVYISVDELFPEAYRTDEMTRLRFVISSIHLKIMCGDLNKTKEDENSPILGEFNIESLTLGITSNMGCEPGLRDVELLITKPYIKIFCVFLDVLQTMKSQNLITKSTEPESEKESTAHLNTSVLGVIRNTFISACLRVQTDNLDIEFSDNQNRTLHASLQSISWESSIEIQSNLYKPMLMVKIVGATLQSKTVNIFHFYSIQCSAKGDIEIIDLNMYITGGFVGYHFDEWRHWKNAIYTSQANVKSVSLHKSKFKTFSNLLSGRQLKVSAFIRNISGAIATTKCNGIKLGLAEMRCNLLKKNLKENGFPSGDIRIDMEMTSLYLKLTDGGASSVDLSSRVHHKNTLLYLGLLVVKSVQADNHCSLDTITDNLQIELSTLGISVLSSLLSNMCDVLPKNLSIKPNIDDSEIMDVTSSSKFVSFKTLEVNAQSTNVNVFISYQHKVCTCMRLDQIITYFSKHRMDIQFHSCKITYQIGFEKRLNILRAAEINDGVFSFKQLNANIFFKTDDKLISIETPDNITLHWSMALHLCIFDTLHSLKELITLGCKNAPQKQSSSSQFAINLSFPGNTLVVLNLQNHHSVTISLADVNAKKESCETTLCIRQLTIDFDDHKIVNVQNISSFTHYDNDKITMERRSIKALTLPSNVSIIVQFDTLDIIFPFGYTFSECFDEVKLLKKWLKLKHRLSQNKPNEDNLVPVLPPDLIIKIKHVKIQVNDDMFEVKIGDNYKLACDEYSEHEKRIRTLNMKILDLRKKHGLLPSSKVDELYDSLEASRSGHYIRRSKGLYASSPQRETLWTWNIDNLDLTAHADPSMHGTSNVLKHMEDIDSDSPGPNTDLTFVTLWCRYINVSCSLFKVSLRDYNLPLLNIHNLHVWGRFIGAEQNGTYKAKRPRNVSQGFPWGDIIIEKNMPAIKFYHDFSCDVSQFDIAYGGCWEPAMAQFNLSLNKINQPSADPSRPLPFWDKLRLLLHGRVTMSLQRMRWLYHASLDPYNKTEVMDWTWTNLILDWINAKWVFRGDLDIYARTASKYDDCRLLHLPNLRFTIRLIWLTQGNPNDHHSVEPCAPEKKKLLSEQDSYASFRSQHLNCELSFETREMKDDLPGCLFYASTLRWMDKVKMCMGRVSRPIRRGRVFHHMAARKIPLSRHVKQLNFSFSLHKFEIDYWASFARQSGVKGTGGPVSITLGMQLYLRYLEDGLFHRPLADWQIKEFNGELNKWTMWLNSILPDKRQSKAIPLQAPTKRNYFLSVENVTYQRTEAQCDDEDDTRTNDLDNEYACHRVKVMDLKGAWTPSNRDVAFALYDAYVKSQRIKKNLSSEALQRYKVEHNQSPGKQYRPLNTSGAKALFMLASPKVIPKENDPTYTMLQKLVSESDTKFVAANEEMPEPEVLVRQLHGISVCEKEDVTRKNWHVELYNSQVVLRGVETSGYVIVSAAKVSLLACDHKPVWQSQQLQSKSTLIGSVESMQYYATVANLDTDEDMVWLSKQNIMENSDTTLLTGLENTIGLADMVGSGESVGGVVTNVVCDELGVSPPKIQLQRIVSRCHCEFFYAGYGEVEDKTLPELPLSGSESEGHMMQKEEGLDCFTILHHDLNICTNSVQYDMILDIINNLLLYVEPKKKELTEKLQNMRFSLQLSSVDDQRTPILQRQNNLRELLQKTRKLEKDLFNLQQNCNDREDLFCRSLELHNQLELCKENVNALSEELAIMVSCFKESQLQVSLTQRTAVTQKEAPVSRLYEVCFKHAEWRMTEDDGQIGIADLVLKNFLYKKTNCEDDSGSHQLDLGWVKVTNLLPGTPYRDVLVPRDPLGKVLPERQATLRILCKFKAPVGGISVKEHFEVNVSPLTIQLTARFYRTAMSYFFRDKQEGVEEAVNDEDIQGDSESQQALSVVVRPKKKDDSKDIQNEYVKCHYTSNLSLVGDIDKMRERAAKNNMFLYIKIPQVPLRVSYKGDKEKNITNINDFQFLLPTLEYHDHTWTWHDLALVVKNDTKRKLIGQAVQQKLNIKMHLYDLLQEDLHEEVDKAKLLLGTLSTVSEKKGKKSLFGNKKS